MISFGQRGAAGEPGQNNQRRCLHALGKRRRGPLNHFVSGGQVVGLSNKQRDQRVLEIGTHQQAVGPTHAFIAAMRVASCRRMVAIAGSA